MNEGVDDLAAFSAILAPINPDQTGPLGKPLQGAAEVHARYLSLYVIDDGGKVLHAAGKGRPTPEPLELVKPFEKAGMRNAARVEGSPVPIILQYAPLPERDGEGPGHRGGVRPVVLPLPPGGRRSRGGVARDE